MDQALQEILSEKQIFMNPDLVSEISKNFDFLSYKERDKFLYMLQSIPDLAKLSEPEKHKFLKEVFQARAQYNKSLYNSGILKEDTPITYRGNDFTYSFSIIYPKSESMDIDKAQFTNKLSKMVNLKNFGDIQSILPKDRLIWNLNNVAGKIRILNKNIIYEIYCNDRETICVRDYTDNELRYILYYKNGKLHRERLPAILQYLDGKLVGEYFYKNGKPHSDNGPAEIVYQNCDLEGVDDDCFIVEEVYYKNGKIHREGGPAITTRNKSGYVIRREWYINDKKHREDGPAVVRYDGTAAENVTKEIWYKKDIKQKR